MKKLFITITFATIICGVIGVGLQFMFGYNTITYISRENINNVWIYKYDFWGYIENIKTTISTPNLELNIPDREWNNDLINNLAVILNVLIMIVNCILYVFRIGALVIRTLLSFVGINVIDTTSSNGLYWLINLVNTLNGLQLGYV